VSDRASRLAALARGDYGALCARFPEQLSQGGALFLGKHYALRPRGVLMLGVSPGPAPDAGFDTGLSSVNVLLPGGANTNVRYWRNARRLFGTTPALLQAMEEATYSFCCPFRTDDWVGLRWDKRAALIQHSLPVMIQMLFDVDPRVVIVAGVAGETLFRRVVGPGLRMDSPFSRSDRCTGTYVWRARSASFATVRFTLAQIPNLWRARSPKELERCGLWLTDMIGRAESGATAQTAR
jgi:hypothetical protein